MLTLAAIKRRIVVGIRLKCIENTYRPVLNGTEREVVRVQTNAFVWKSGDDPKEQNSWTRYPKAKDVRAIDENTFKFRLFDDHWVTLQFLQVDQAVNSARDKAEREVEDASRDRNED